MRSGLARAFTASVLTLAIQLPVPGHAAVGPRCGQPLTQGEAPTARDALAILRAAVGGDSCESMPCLCDVDGDAGITASDALRTLRRAVGTPVGLLCSCTGCADATSCLACTSFEFAARSGSRLDLGWSGAAHDIPWYEGVVFTADVLRRCSSNGEPCTADSDCDGQGFCEPTCDCISDTSCELTGPTQERHCLYSLATCESDEDCGFLIPCVPTLGPQLPALVGGFPQCTTFYFDGDLSGNVDVATGDFEWTAKLKRYVVVGGGSEFPVPCPRCGLPEQQPKPGQTFTCQGGGPVGGACTVDAVHPQFGGVSYDCPAIRIALSPNPVSLGRVTVTTQGVERGAAFPCTGPYFASHPSRGNGKCVDDATPCSSNADCLRCTAQPALSCSTNADCDGKGACAAAPEQPVSCGYWCHCGFCAADELTPCFDDSQCATGDSCQKGTGTSKANQPQSYPNNCELEPFVCGMAEAEQCATTLSGRCTLHPQLACGQNSDCEQVDAGVCAISNLSCFESSIRRQGEISTVGPGVVESTGVALACAPALISSFDYVEGTTGPVAISLNTRVVACYCGDSQIGCGEQCDDGNTANGDGCSDRCRSE